MRRPRNDDDYNSDSDSRKQSRYKPNQQHQQNQQNQQRVPRPNNIPQLNVQAQDYINKQRNNYEILRTCVNNFDPLFPDRPLNLNAPIVLLFDNDNKKWCFNLLTLWNKIKDSMYYDIVSLKNVHGFDYTLCSFVAANEQFNISIRMFDILKIRYLHYYHGVVVNPLI